MGYQRGCCLLSQRSHSGHRRRAASITAVAEATAVTGVGAANDTGITAVITTYTAKVIVVNTDEAATITAVTAAAAVDAETAVNINAAVTVDPAAITVPADVLGSAAAGAGGSALMAGVAAGAGEKEALVEAVVSTVMEVAGEGAVREVAAVAGAD